MLVVEKRRIISPFFDQTLLGATLAVAFFIRGNGILLLVTLRNHADHRSDLESTSTKECA